MASKTFESSHSESSERWFSDGADGVTFIFSTFQFGFFKNDNT